MSLEAEKKACATCGEPLQSRYCHHCGEKVHFRHEFAFQHYFREIMHQVTSLDVKIFNTLRVLVTKPGQLTEEYLLGRKNKYIRPLRLYLSSSMLYFFSFSFFNKAALVDIRNVLRFDFSGRLLPLITAKQQLSGLTGEIFFREVNQQLNNKIALLLIPAIFAYALVFKAVFFAKKRYYAEHLIFCLHLMSFSFLRDVLFLPIFLMHKPLGFALALASTMVYLFLSMKRVYSAKVFKMFLATLALYSAFGVILCVCTAFALYQILMP